MELTKEKIDAWIERAYRNACEHGFHEENHPLEHLLMLVVTEVSEAVEAHRRGKRALYRTFNIESTSKQPVGNEDKHWKYCFEIFIKNSVGDELSDVCIRLFDIYGKEGLWYGNGITPNNQDEGYKQWEEDFGKLNFTQIAFEFIGGIMESYKDNCIFFDYLVFFIFCWAEHLGIDLAWHIEQKMRYNSMRERKHGKLY